MTTRATGPVLGAILLLAGGASARAEEITVDDAYFAYGGTGTTYSLADDHLYWVGDLTGMSTTHGAGDPRFDNVAVQCPGWLDIDIGANRQKGAGFCTHIAPGGATFVSEWSCEGTIDPDTCTGSNTVVSGSGTGALEGLTGTGTIAATATIVHANGATSSYTMVDMTYVLP
ncbi:hypothetical protein Rumeso_01821 [Rubellimicrobium mesophilum DSM 19309]|uniref:Uncharacterized protein n=1 Tax=Rubellimicrobium mesophilum DSM 19309 TaxID=442562 RepID=A0A017HRR3_9RHOB|nr:DUF3224 domain-containing protein [Rubellimicrobium mesophilum]EYD76863.1 hypothetical protein Rumeso_01821 [Rubellimicrobium mesophilum DSM 19309]